MSTEQNEINKAKLAELRADMQSGNVPAKMIQIKGDWEYAAIGIPVYDGTAHCQHEVYRRRFGTDGPFEYCGFRK